MAGRCGSRRASSSQAEDRARRHSEPACDLGGGEGEERLEAQDAVAGLGRVVRPLAVGDLVPAGGEDLDRLLEESDVEGLLLELGEAVEGRVAGIAVLAKPLDEGEAEEMSGLDEGLGGEGVEPAPRHGGTQEAVEVGEGTGAPASRVKAHARLDEAITAEAPGRLPNPLADGATRARAVAPAVEPW